MEWIAGLLAGVPTDWSSSEGWLTGYRAGVLARIYSSLIRGKSDVIRTLFCRF
jgi:hypothetical protein